ncbi:DUF2085 domain-containing protein [Melioribacter sp. Ez-97]|uniref:DUF2085 domain-containing protein n=1 Tax=Melioribacter sp. Ez-97 TaxID=3423434 RepID=UPI003ED9CF26
MKFVYRIILFLSLSFWFLLILSEFWIYNLPDYLYLLPFIKKAFSVVCHQNPERSIFIDGHSLLVCSRCAGIYAGALLSALAAIFYGKIFLKSNMPLYLLSIPLAIDWLLVILGVKEYSKITAAFTGFLFGSIIFLYFYSSLNNKNRNR